MKLSVINLEVGTFCLYLTKWIGHYEIIAYVHLLDLVKDLAILAMVKYCLEHLLHFIVQF